jgi:hypothetical protein
MFVFCREAAVDFDVDWAMLQQFCIAEPRVALKCPFIWNIFYEVKAFSVIVTAMSMVMTASSA